MHTLRWPLSLFLFICCLSVQLASAAVPVPAAPRLSANSYMLMDFNSGRVLAERAIDERLEPASLTKMMTAYVVYHELAAGSLSLAEKTVVSEKAGRMGGSRMFI